MHFFGHNINSVHASDDLQVFKIPYPLEDTSLKKLHGVRQCSRPQWCSSSMPTRFTSVAISSWTNILEQDHAHQPFHSFAHVHARRHPVSKHQPVKDATSARNHPTSDIPYLCNLQDRLSFTLPPINMEVQKWVPPIIVTFQKTVIFPFHVYERKGICQLSMFQI